MRRKSRRDVMKLTADKPIPLNGGWGQCVCVCVCVCRVGSCNRSTRRDADGYMKYKCHTRLADNMPLYSNSVILSSLAAVGLLTRRMRPILTRNRHRGPHLRTVYIKSRNTTIQRYEWEIQFDGVH